MSKSHFDFLKIRLPRLHVLAVEAERSVRNDPMSALGLLKDAGEQLVRRILIEEEIMIDGKDTLALLEHLAANEIVPLPYMSVLKRLEYADKRESAWIVGVEQVSAILLQMYDLMGWYYRTYMDDTFEIQAMVLPAVDGNFGLAAQEQHRAEALPQAQVRIDGIGYDSVWEHELRGEPNFVAVRQEGHSYEGQMVNGMKQGKGIHRWADGTRYIGQWYRDREHGTGEKHFANGDVYRGEWRDGMFGGRGCYEWRDGARYEGEWQEHMEHGFGRKTEPDGTVRQGFWVRGEFVFPSDRLEDSGNARLSGAKKRPIRG